MGNIIVPVINGGVGIIGTTGITGNDGVAVAVGKGISVGSGTTTGGVGAIIVGIGTNVVIGGVPVSVASGVRVSGVSGVGVSGVIGKVMASVGDSVGVLPTFTSILSAHPIADVVTSPTRIRTTKMASVSTLIMISPPYFFFDSGFNS